MQRAPGSKHWPRHPAGPPAVGGVTSPPVGGRRRLLPSAPRISGSMDPPTPQVGCPGDRGSQAPYAHRDPSPPPPGLMRSRDLLSPRSLPELRARWAGTSRVPRATGSFCPVPPAKWLGGPPEPFRSGARVIEAPPGHFPPRDLPRSPPKVLHVMAAHPSHGRSGFGPLTGVFLTGGGLRCLRSASGVQAVCRYLSRMASPPAIADPSRSPLAGHVWLVVPDAVGTEEPDVGTLRCTAPAGTCWCRPPWRCLSQPGA